MLEALFLASCHITGPIPAWISELKALRQLDLQHNALSGQLPPEVSSLSNLLYLNLKDNAQLGGVLPVDQVRQ